MAKFFLKLFLFAVLAVIANNLIFSVFRLPFYWGNDIAVAKGEYLLKHKQDYNTIFIGTSRTYWQADVSTFDSLVHHKTRSFNFGIDAVAAAEMYYYTKNIVDLDTNIRYAFIEVFDIDLIVDQNLHTLRQKYWYNYDSWVFTMKSIWHSNFDTESKIRGLTYNTINFFEWLLKFDLLKDVAIYKSTLPDAGYLGPEKNGFVALGSEIIDTADHLRRRRILFSDTTVSQKLAKGNLRVIAHGDSYKFNGANYDELEELIKKLRDRNIEVFIIAAPRMNETQMADVWPAYLKADNCQKINLADPRLNPEFYQLKYIYDPNHLNCYGDSIYTAKMAEAFNQAIAKR